MFSISTLIWGAIFGTIGTGFFVFGRKQKKAVPLLVGFSLFFLPYTISNVFVLVLVGLVLTFLPFIFKI